MMANAGAEPPTAAGLGRRIAAGLDPVEYTLEVLARIQGDDTATFLSCTEVRALREAEGARGRQQEGRLRGPLDGVPVAWKDLIDIAGSVTTCGSELLRNAAPAAGDARCAANAAAAGMITVGKTNLTEFAFSGLGINAHFGTPANPRDPHTLRVPGGSSSGSAVAVARGLTPVAVGTDTGGSIRIPASFNGIVGLKGSADRIALAGVTPLAPSLDTVGPLAQTVEDCLLLEAVLRGAAPEIPQAAPAAALAILVPENYAMERLEAAVAANFERSLDVLGQSGIRIRRRRVDILDAYGAAFADHGMLTAYEAMQSLQAHLDGPDADRIDRRIRDRVLTGAAIADRVEEVRATRARLAREFAREIGGQFLLHPTTAHTAPEIAPLDADPELYRRINMRTLRNTMPGNYLQACGISLPNGVDRNGLPTGILLSAPAGADSRLHAAALTVESLLRNGS